MTYVREVKYMQVCWRLASRIRMEFRPDPARKLYGIYHCCMYSEKLLMMDKGTLRSMQSFISTINLEISVSNWFYYKNLSRCTVTWTSNPSLIKKANLHQITEIRFAMKYLYRSRVARLFVYLLFNYHPVRRTTGYIATPLDDIVCELLCSALIGCRVLGTASQYRENRYRFHLIGYRLFHKHAVITGYT